MSWLQTFGYFALGFLKGFAESRAERRLGDAGRSEDWSGWSYDFVEHMYWLSRESGLSHGHITDRRATFFVPWEGRTFIAVVVWSGEMLSISALSLIRFPPGGAPSTVCRALVEHNRELPNCDYELIDDDDGAFFFIQGRIRTGALTPDAFRSALLDLVPKIASLDRLLVKYGYVR